MKKFLLALLFGLCTTDAALAQRVQSPTNAGMVCQYNLSLPVLATGWFGYAQCDANGKLIISSSGGASDASAANQVTGNNSLASIDTKTPALGQALAASSRPVVFPSDPDLRPVAQNITIIDSGSTTTAGYNSVNIVTGSATANSTAAQAINGQSSGTITVTGTWTGTLTFEISGDGGTTWATTATRQRGSAGVLGPRTGTTTGNGIFVVDLSAMTNFRARATAAMTGTAVVKYDLSATAGPVQIQTPISIYDNTSNVSLTVKPASTAPIATDPAVVVSLSPNSSSQAVSQAASSVASGAYSAGSYAAGALAAGAFATGAGVDGWDLTQGAKADGVYAGGGGSASVISLLKGLYVGLVAATPAGANIIGKVGIDQTTPGTTNGVSQNASTPITTTMQSAAVASGNGTLLNVSGMSAAVLTVNCATCSGGTTVNFEGTQDGTNYSAVNAVQVGTTTIASLTAASGISLWETPVGGFTSLRARISGYSAGTVTVTGSTVPVAYNAKVVSVTAPTQAPVAPGAATATKSDLIGCQYNSTISAFTNGQQGQVSCGTAGEFFINQVPSASALVAGALNVTSAAASNLVAKASAGNLYSYRVTSGATSGYVMVFDATSAPVDGAVTPKDCVVLGANQTWNSPFEAIPEAYTTGITIVFSSTGCFTKTASATAFIKAKVK